MQESGERQRTPNGVIKHDVLELHRWTFGLRLCCAAVTREGRETMVNSRCCSVTIPRWCHHSTHILDFHCNNTAGKLAWSGVRQQNFTVASHKEASWEISGSLSYHPLDWHKYPCSKLFAMWLFIDMCCWINQDVVVLFLGKVSRPNLACFVQQSLLNPPEVLFF